MRRKDKGIQDRGEIEEILAKALVCRLGLCCDNVPYVVPLSFGYSDGCLYFHSAREGRKIDMVRKNARVCFEIDIIPAAHGGDQGQDPRDGRQEIYVSEKRSRRVSFPGRCPQAEPTVLRVSQNQSDSTKPLKRHSPFRMSSTRCRFSPQ